MPTRRYLKSGSLRLGIGISGRMMRPLSLGVNAYETIDRSERDAGGRAWK
jgi:hypothetical protein